MTRALHRIRHIFGWNAGRVESFWLDDDLWIGFRCNVCDEINGAHKTVWSDKSIGCEESVE